MSAAGPRGGVHESPQRLRVTLKNRYMAEGTFGQRTLWDISWTLNDRSHRAARIAMSTPPLTLIDSYIPRETAKSMPVLLGALTHGAVFSAHHCIPPCHFHSSQTPRSTRPTISIPLPPPSHSTNQRISPSHQTLPCEPKPRRLQPPQPFPWGNIPPPIRIRKILQQTPNPPHLPTLNPLLNIPQ